MAEDWAADVRKYVPDADEAIIAGIVRYCGIALRNRDSSLVSFSDATETARVRDNFCRKKLALTAPDSEVDAAIARVGDRMKADRTRNRVTVYYLLAAEFDKLGLFRSAKAASAAAAVGSAAPAAAAVAAAPLFSAPAAAAPVASVAPPMPAAVAMPPAAPMPAAAPMPRTAAAPAMRPAAAPVRYDNAGDGTVSTALIALGVLGAGILVAATLGSLIGRGFDRTVVTADPAPDFSAAPAAAAVAPAVPTGAGVVAAEAAGKPMLSVYFDTAKSDVTADFAAAAAPVKAWFDGHPGAKLAVSGFNDPTGNAAANAELSKNRAKAVAAALTGIGIPAAAVTLRKPAETTDTGTSAAQARRVEVTFIDAG